MSLKKEAKGKKGKTKLGDEFKVEIVRRRGTPTVEQQEAFARFWELVFQKHLPKVMAELARGNDETKPS